jgi:nitroreductase
MSFISLVRDRRSIRKYAERAVEAEKIEQLVEAALRAPSSRMINPWRYVVVSDAALLSELSRSKPHGASFLKNARLGFVVCADTTRSDVWIEDASIACIYLHLAATALGLGSCWIQIRKRMHNDHLSAEDYIRNLLDIPSDVAVEAILAVGYPQEDKKPHPPEYLQYEKVFLNRYGAGYK